MSCLNSFRSGLCALVLLGSAATLMAQTPTSPRLFAGSGSIERYVPGRWGTLRGWLVNPADKPVEVLFTSFFDADPTLQYGRRVWLPAKSSVRTHVPLLVPKLEDADRKSLDVRFALIETASDGREVLLKRENEGLKTEQSLWLAPPRALTGIVDSRRGIEFEAPALPSVSETVSAGRATLEIHISNVVYLTDTAVLPGEMTFDALDQIVIADNDLLNDSAALTGMRQWIAGGGRVWIMLDRVDPKLPEVLLGDEFDCQFVDRVGLTTVTFDPVPRELDGTQSTADHEIPVELVRVIPGDVEQLYTVNGWPAAFWKRVGEGSVLFTTVAAPGWLRQRTENDPKPEGENRETPEFIALQPYEKLAERLFAARKEPLIQPAQASDHIVSNVGYSVPPGTLIIGVLAVFSMLLVGVAALLWKQTRLEWLAVIGPTTAVVAGAALVLVGRGYRESIPPTTSLLQVVEPIPGTNQVRLSGRVALFAPQSAAAQISGASGGWILPDRTDAATRRMVWLDLDRWQWEHVTAQPGLSEASFVEPVTLGEPLTANLTLDPGGVVGRVNSGGEHEIQTGILVTPEGRLGLDFKPGGNFQGNAAGVLSANQFSSAVVLTDEQLRRDRTLQQLLADRGSQMVFPHPTLCLWTSPWETGLVFDPNSRKIGSTLIVLPAQFTRPEPGTEITIPSTLLRMREALKGPDGSAPTGVYDYRRRQWTEKSRSASAWLELSPPSELLPLTPQSAELRIRVTGPIQKLRISVVKGTRIEPLKEWTSPVGTLTLDIADADVLTIQNGAYVLLGVSVEAPENVSPDGSLTDGRQASYWQIESLSLTMRARIDGTQAADSQSPAAARNAAHP